MMTREAGERNRTEVFDREARRNMIKGYIVHRASTRKGNDVDMLSWESVWGCGDWCGRIDRCTIELNCIGWVITGLSITGET